MNQKVSEYINKQPLRQKETLVNVYEFVRKLIPNAEEKMSYGVPAFRLNNKQILYAAFKNHLGIYPEPEIIEKFKEELKDFETTQGTIKFNLDKPIPYDLIKKIVVYKFKL